MGIRNYLNQLKQDINKFNDRNKYSLNLDNKKPVQDLYRKCSECETASHYKSLKRNNYLCPKCDHHMKLKAKERLSMICDRNSFKEFGLFYELENILKFPKYEEKIKYLQQRTQLHEAVVTGYATINNIRTVVIVMDSHFLMGSMGFVVGHKITAAIERATHKKLPIVLFAASGGARMQEGIISLMQMAKTSAALAKHNKKGLLYIPVLTNPTYGGVTASFAMLGDIILAEPNAMIGFAGKRVIENTIREELPEGFQTSEFLLEKGFIDLVVHRSEIKSTLINLLTWHKGGK